MLFVSFDMNPDGCLCNYHFKNAAYIYISICFSKNFDSVGKMKIGIQFVGSDLDLHLCIGTNVLILDLD